MNEHNLPVTRRNEERPFAALRERMDRIFDDFAFGFPTFAGGGSNEFLPRAELKETDKELAVSLELPGVDKDNFEVTVQERTVSISGEKSHSDEKRDGDIYRSERSYGSFSRSFTAPFPIDADKVHARFDNGVLKVTIQKPDGYSAKARQIEIQH